MIKLIVKEMRITHYVKNILLFIPLFFSGNFINIYYLGKTFIIFISFSLICSSIYILNDIIDYNFDKNHPIKKNRPIASGKLKRKVACIFGGLLFIIGTVTMFTCSIQAAIFAMIYTTLNILYSIKFKNIILIDVFCIALSFVLRIFVGAATINIQVSSWLLLTILCLSLYLAFGKRKKEVSINEKNDTRKVLKSYSIEYLDRCMFSMMSLTIVFYSLWTIDTQNQYSDITIPMVYTVPLVILGLLRYSHNIDGNSDGDPTYVILGDKVLLSIGAILAILISLCIYV